MIAMKQHLRLKLFTINFKAQIDLKCVNERVARTWLIINPKLET